MYLRLYFLLPDENLARRVVDDLIDSGLQSKHIHAHRRINHSDTSGLKRPRMWQTLDLAEKIENVVWKGDLIVFFVAFAVFIYSLSTSHIVLTIVTAAIMLISFILGDFFASYVPRVHLGQFEDALSHGEVLLMVDVPKSRVVEIENRVHAHHPYVIDGGSSWTIQSLGI